MKEPAIGGIDVEGNARKSDAAVRGESVAKLAKLCLRDCCCCCLVRGKAASEAAVARGLRLLHCGL